MKVLAKQNRELIMINAQNTQNENNAEKIILQVPEQYEDFNKKIVFVTPDGIVWDLIVNDEYLIKKAITKYKQVDFYIWLTKDDEDWRSKTKTLKFYYNVDASDEITDEEIGRVNTVINLLEEEITKVENLESQVDGKLEEIDTAIDNVNTAIQETENLNLDAEKVGQTTTITLTKKNGTTKVVHVDDGVDLQFMWQGTSLGIKTAEQQEYTFVNLQGIRGEVGLTPNIQIGTVTQGTSFNVTRTGTNENPILNFTLVKGDKGDQGIQGIQGLTGNGISSIRKTGTSGLVDTYTITYTNGNTTTFTVTNGEDGEVTETELNVLRQKLEDQQKVINQLPQVEGQGTEVILKNTIEAQFTKFDVEGNSTQDGEPSPDNEVPIKSAGDNGSINEKIQNKNIFDGEMELGTLSNDDGRPVNINTQIRTKNFTRVKSNSVCSLSNSNNYTTFIYMYDKNKKLIKYINSASFTTTEDTKFIKFRTVANQTDLTTKFQLEYGNATSYVPHEEQNISIPVQQPMMDDDYFDRENNEEVHTWQKIVLDGTVNYSQAARNPDTNFTTLIIARSDCKQDNNPTNIKSDSFVPLPQAWANIKQGISRYTNGNIYVCIEDEDLANGVITAKEFFTEHPAVVYYPLAEPTKLPFTQEQIEAFNEVDEAYSYKGGTYISSEDEVNPRLEVSALLDLNSLITRLEIIESEG